MAFLLCLRLFVFLVVTGGRLAVLPEPSLSLEDEWTAFKVEFNKTYPSQAEHDRRKLILLETLAVIKKHNAEYNLSDPNAPHFKMGLNEFCKFFLIDRLFKLLIAFFSRLPKPTGLKKNSLQCTEICHQRTSLLLSMNLQNISRDVLKHILRNWI